MLIPLSESQVLKKVKESFRLQSPHGLTETSRELAPLNLGAPVQGFRVQRLGFRVQG